MTALTPDGQKFMLGLELFTQIMAGPSPIRLAENGHPVLNYGTEAELRTRLALLAFGYGWDVEQEVVIPGWGRIDLVLRDSLPGAILIELKRDLKKPAEARRGFQQADGYGRWWTAHHGEPAQVILSAGEHSASVIAPVAARYPEVRFLPANEVMAFFGTWGDPRVRSARASRRAQELASLAAVYRYAAERMGGVL